MTEDPCRHWQQYLGAYAIDRLAQAERYEVEQHIQSCERCANELKNIAPIAELLPLANPHNVSRKPHIDPQAADTLFAKIAVERRAQRRVRYATTSALAIAAAIIIALLVIPTVRGSEPGQKLAFPTPQNMSVKARVVNQSWGSKIYLDISGLSGQQTVWYEGPNGEDWPAGLFDGISGHHQEIALNSSITTNRAIALCISPTDKSMPVLKVPLKA